MPADVVTIEGDAAANVAVAGALATRLGWQWCSLADLDRASVAVVARTGRRESVADLRLEVAPGTGRVVATFEGRLIDGQAPSADDVRSLLSDPFVRSAVAAELRRFVGQGPAVVEGGDAGRAFPDAALRVRLGLPSRSIDQVAPLQLGMTAWDQATWSLADTVSRLYRRVETAVGLRRWTVSVVMPARDSERNLALVLPRLARAAAASAADVQVIVVDDGSRDRTAAVAAAGGAEVVSLASSLGISRARNVGLQRATGDVLVFLDSDMLVEADFLVEHLRLHAAASDTVVVGGRAHLPPGVVDTGNAGILRKDSREALLDLYSYNMGCLAHPWSLAYGCNVSVDRWFLERAAPGGFDESFVGWGLEDQELAYRLAQYGARWAYSRRASGAHLHHDRVVTTARFEGWMANLRRFVDKHAAASALERLVPGMTPPPARAYADCYHRFDGGPTTAELAGPVVLQVSGAKDPLLAVQKAVATGMEEVIVVDEGDHSEMAVLLEAVAPGLGVRFYTADDWDRLSVGPPRLGARA